MTKSHAYRNTITGVVATYPDSIARTFAYLEQVDDSEAGCTTCGPAATAVVEENPVETEAAPVAEPVVTPTPEAAPAAAEPASTPVPEESK